MAGRAVAGGGRLDRQTPTEGQKNGQRKKKKKILCPTTTCACHHAHPPLCTCAARHGNAHYYSYLQAWHVFGRARAAMADQEERGASGARGGAAPHHFPAPSEHAAVSGPVSSPPPPPAVPCPLTPLHTPMPTRQAPLGTRTIGWCDWCPQFRRWPSTRASGRPGPWKSETARVPVSSH